jgi:serine/threonine protein kinase
MSEVNNYELLDHANIVKILGTNWFECPREKVLKFGLILPIFDTDLRSYIDYMPTRLPRKNIKKLQREIKLQIAAALSHVHQAGLCHADLKPENFLINTANDTSVCVQLADMGSAIKISEMPLKITSVRTTMFYQPPEVTEHDQPFFSSAGDVYSLGRIFCEVERTSEQDDSNQTSSTVPLEYFTPLTQDMIKHNFHLRPTMPKVLERLGESMELLCINGLPCDDIVTNVLENKMDIISSTSYDKSLGLHRLLTLLRSDKSDYIEASFWLLQSLAVEEAFSSTRPSQSVLSILPYFHTRIHVNDNDSGRSTFNKLMYCRALEALCRRPYFLLSDDMKLNLRAFSIIPACERSVLMVMAKTSETFPEVLEWCGNGKWGKFGDRFDVFVNRFVEDWRLDVASVACQMLGMPPPTVDYMSATTHIVYPQWEDA